MKYLIIVLSLLINQEPELSKANDFEFVLVDGTVKKLSDYEGEVVYLSFWASWCGHCIANFNKYHDIRDELEEMGVVLINISIDEQKSDWTYSLDRNKKINGLNALVKDVDLVKNIYNVTATPLYEIVNKKGELVYLNDGDNRDIFADFTEWLAE